MSTPDEDRTPEQGAPPPPPPPPGWSSGPAYPPPGQPTPPPPSYPSQPTQPYPAEPYPTQPQQQPGWSGQQPPQGWPGQPAPGYAPPPPGWRPPALQPGAIPLRPLGLGDLYNGAFAVLRRNLGATVGASVLVSAVAGVLPLLAALVFGGTLSGIDLESSEAPSDSQLVALGLLGVAVGIGLLVQGLGAAFVTGMIARVSVGAARGEVFRLPEAWAATRGRRWRVVGLLLLLTVALIVALTLLIVVLVVLATASTALAVVGGFVLVPTFIVAWIYLYVRVYLLAVPTLVVEGLGVFAALRRAHTLSKGSFWRLFGIALLTGIVAGIAAGVIASPFSIGSQIVAGLSPENAIVAIVVGQVGTQLVSSALSAPFTGAVRSLQYVDQRIRREAYDVELLAGLPGGPSGA